MGGAGSARLGGSCAEAEAHDVEELGVGTEEQHENCVWTVYPGPVYVLKAGLTSQDIEDLRAEVEGIRQHHSAHIRGPVQLYDDQEAAAKMLCTFNYYTPPRPTDPEPKVAFDVAGRFLRDFGATGEACLTIQYPQEEVIERSLPFHVDLDGRGGPVLSMSWGASCDFLWKASRSGADDDAAAAEQPLACGGCGDRAQALSFAVEEGDVVFFDGGQIPHAIRCVGGERFNIQIRVIGATFREKCASQKLDFLDDFSRQFYEKAMPRYPFGSRYSSWYVVEEPTAADRQAVRIRKMYIDLLISIIRNERSREPEREVPKGHVHDIVRAQAYLERLQQVFDNRMDAGAFETYRSYVELLGRVDTMYAQWAQDAVDLDTAVKHLEKMSVNFGNRPEVDLATVYGYFLANRPVAHSLGERSQLTNTQACVERVLADGVPGNFIETGVWQGGQTILMRGVLKAYGIHDRRVYVADSFQGLPEVDPETAPDDAIALGILDGIGRFRVTADDVRRNFAAYGLLDEQVVFLEGWFSDTLPYAELGALAVVRLDGDFYDSTRDAIEILYPRLSSGGFVIVDDYGCPFGCKRAIDEYRSNRGIEVPMLRASKQTVYWRKP